MGDAPCAVPQKQYYTTPVMTVCLQRRDSLPLHKSRRHVISSVFHLFSLQKHLWKVGVDGVAHCSQSKLTPLLLNATALRPVRLLVESTDVCEMHRGCYRAYRLLASGTQSPQEAQAQTSLLIAHLMSLGFTINVRECFGSYSKHIVRRLVPQFSDVQSMSVRRESGSLSGLSGTLSQGNDVEVQNVPQTVRSDGVGVGSSPAWPPTYEAGSAMGWVASLELNPSRHGHRQVLISMACSWRCARGGTRPST